jgi:hypothetical protein
MAVQRFAVSCEVDLPRHNNVKCRNAVRAHDSVRWEQ